MKASTRRTVALAVAGNLLMFGGGAAFWAWATAPSPEATHTLCDVISVSPKRADSPQVHTPKADTEPAHAGVGGGAPGRCLAIGLAPH